MIQAQVDYKERRESAQCSKLLRFRNDNDDDGDDDGDDDDDDNDTTVQYSTVVMIQVNTVENHAILNLECVYSTEGNNR
jgi:hypothetical protein